MTTEIIFSKLFEKHDTQSHPENAERLRVMMTALQNASFYHDLRVVEPVLLPEKLLYAVHTPEMIQLVKDISAQGDSWIDLDTYVSRGDYETARYAAGGVFQACTDVLDGVVENAFALVRPPGHHAGSDRSMGFCLFNNAAIAAQEISQKKKRVLIFDHDVHHGNGTQLIFNDDKMVMYQSIHLSPHYPGTGGVSEVGVGAGEGYTVNAPLSFGVGDASVRKLLHEVFLPVAEQFDPDIILVSAGYDSHHADQLGGMRLSTNFFGEIIRLFQGIQPRIVCTLEGGYNLDWVGNCLLSQVSRLMHHPQHFSDSVEEEVNADAVLVALKKMMSKYWKLP
ncbi:MAG: histone deacetylase [Methanobacteriota archaeon]